MSSVFTSLITKVLDVPGDPGQSITIRKLAPKHRQAAMKASQQRALADLREMGGAVFLEELKALQVSAPDTTPTEKSAPRDPLLTHDALTLLEHGIVGWTYDRPTERDVYEDLDDEVQEFIAREILRLAKPSLFADYDAEADRKNACAPSIVH